MGRIVTWITVENYGEPKKSIRCSALVDTGSSHVVMPKAWMDRLDLEPMREVTFVTATQQTQTGLLCGPARIQVERFSPVYNEVLFVDMEPIEGFYQVLVGFLVLEQSGIAVDTLGQRLLKVPYFEVRAAV